MRPPAIFDCVSSEECDGVSCGIVQPRERIQCLGVRLLKFASRTSRNSEVQVPESTRNDTDSKHNYDL